jgi:hypothetical protein
MDHHEQIYIRNPKFRNLEKEQKDREEANEKGVS